MERRHPAGIDHGPQATLPAFINNSTIITVILPVQAMHPVHVGMLPVFILPVGMQPVVMLPVVILPIFMERLRTTGNPACILIDSNSIDDPLPIQATGLVN